MSLLWYFQPVRRQANAFAPSYIEQLRDFILSSPYLSSSTLNQRFATTRGFSITFQRSGMARVVKLFPGFEAYLERVVESRSNAFFLNPLVLGQGNWVSPHVDCSLRSYTRPQEPGFPSKVSVLYVDVPQPFEGGTLILHRNKEVARVTPESNLLVEFVGTLKHEVTAVQRCGSHSDSGSDSGSGSAAAHCARVSLVCEHYRLPASLLDLIPEFYLNSKRKFEDFLDDALNGQAPFAEPGHNPDGGSPGEEVGGTGCPPDALDSCAGGVSGMSAAE